MVLGNYVRKMCGWKLECRFFITCRKRIFIESGRWNAGLGERESEINWYRMDNLIEMSDSMELDAMKKGCKVDRFNQPHAVVLSSRMLQNWSRNIDP